ncbi:MAG: non-canonical purine NTP pyrophosphatase [Candidatus Parvarchaeota archaeon]|jgi:inosine triphosphate pyrophosphatase|nr:non-canonical purine NTP pyrophosphatase [Candidatus Parvarchaeota archaeon]
MEIFYITGNEGKFREAKAILPLLRRLPLDLEEIQSMDPIEVVKQKAEEAVKQSGLTNFVVDDVSLFMEALDYRLPGPFIKWFLKSIGSRGLFDLADKYGKYGVTAVCTLCYVDGKGRKKIFNGKVKGRIVSTGVNSYNSWDNVFLPNGKKMTFADMPLPVKNEISHRGIALGKLKKYLGV